MDRNVLVLLILSEKCASRRRRESTIYRQDADSRYVCFLQRPEEQRIQKNSSSCSKIRPHGRRTGSAEKDWLMLQNLSRIRWSSSVDT